MSKIPKVMLSPRATTSDGSLSPKSVDESFRRSSRRPGRAARRAQATARGGKRKVHFNVNMAANYSEQLPV